MTNSIGQTLSSPQPIVRQDQAQSQLLKMPLEIISRVGQSLAPRGQADLSTTCYVALDYRPEFDKIDIDELRAQVKEIEVFLTAYCSSRVLKAFLPQIYDLVNQVTFRNSKEIKGKISHLLFCIISKYGRAHVIEIGKAQVHTGFFDLKIMVNTLLAAGRDYTQFFSDWAVPSYQLLTFCAEFFSLEDLKERVTAATISNSCQDLEFFTEIVKNLCFQGRYDDALLAANLIEGMLSDHPFFDTFMRMVLMKDEIPYFFESPFFYHSLVEALYQPLDAHFFQQCIFSLREDDSKNAVLLASRLHHPSSILKLIQHLCKTNNEPLLEAVCVDLFTKFSLDEIKGHFLNKLKTKVFALKVCEVLAKDKKYKEAFELADHTSNEAFYLVIDKACNDPKTTAADLINVLSSFDGTRHLYKGLSGLKEYDNAQWWGQYIRMKKGAAYVESFIPALLFPREKNRS